MISGFAVIAVAAAHEDPAALSDVLDHLGDAGGLAVIVAPYEDRAARGDLMSAVRAPLTAVAARPGMRLAPGHVYVIVRREPVVVKDGCFAPAERGRRGAPVAAWSVLFRSVAEQWGPNASAVLLSGPDACDVGALQAIKADGGCVLVQDPASSIYDAAPRAALASGVADAVLAPAAIGHELSRLCRRTGEPGRELDASFDLEAPDGDDSIPDEPFRKVLSLLKNKFRIDLSHYKLTTIRRRVQRRMTMSRFEHMAAYAEHLRSNVDALKELHDDLFIHVTQFFRDPEAFRALHELVFPALLKDRSREDAIRIWVPGCSTGEEAYSLAIALTEFLEQREATASVQIFATDISDAAIEQARKATYPESLMSSVDGERIERFFDRVKDGYKVRKNLRDLCIVSRHDITSNPPFARLDLISCRNVLIYFGPGLQKRIVPIFHYALKPTGFLWLGHSETPGGSSKLFELVDKQNKIYARRPVPASHLQLAGSRFTTETLEFRRQPARDPKRDDLHNRADQMVLFKYGPPGIVIDADLEILQFRGRTAPWLEPPTGQPTQSLLKMAHPDLLPVLRPLVQSSIKQNLTVRRERVLRDRRRGAALNIEVSPLNPLARERERQYLVLFEDASVQGGAGSSPEEGSRPGPMRTAKRARRGGPADRHGEQLQQEIDALREYQQTLIEQFESAQEELTSANEELQATNEEFQSTNEELETAKEELQSANEELTTMNDELQGRNAELVAVNDKLARGEDRFRLMVEGVKEYAIYMLGPEGQVSSWNEGARRLKGYEASEIIGQNYARFFTPEDVATRAPELELEQARIEGRYEAEGWRIRKDGSRFWANVVVTRIDGASGNLIGFSKVTRDLTEKKLAEEALRRANETLEQRVRERTEDLQRALRARDEFLSIASHELKTPLTTLKLQLQVAQRGLLPGRSPSWSPDQSAKTFEKALRQTIALEELVEDLLDISRIQTGRLLLELAEVDLSRLVEDIAARFADQAAHAGAAIKLELETDIIGVWDARRVSQVVVNLISNAIKHAPKSAIHISTRRLDSGQAEIAVEDFGPGIRAEQQATIFERFERGGASPNVGGLGLGLFIGRRIVEAHHGTIRVESEVSRGSRFVVVLPLHPTERRTGMHAEGRSA